MKTFVSFTVKTKKVNKITIYHNNRKIILWETTPEFEDMVENLEIDEPFIHKCNDRMTNILNTFFEAIK